MFWGRTDEAQKYWLTRLDVLKSRAPRVQSEVLSMMQRVQRLYDRGRVNEALNVATDAKIFFMAFTNEIEEAAAQIRARGGVKLRGLDDVMVMMERTREDLDLLEDALQEEVDGARS